MYRRKASHFTILLAVLSQICSLPLPKIEIALHALLAAPLVWSGLQDWRYREVTDWLTWPLFLLGLGAAVYHAVYLDLYFTR
jgi:hypothetical protein